MYRGLTQGSSNAAEGSRCATHCVAKQTPNAQPQTLRELCRSLDHTLKHHNYCNPVCWHQGEEYKVLRAHP